MSPTNVDKSSEMAAFFVFKVGTAGGLCVQMKKTPLLGRCFSLVLVMKVLKVSLTAGCFPLSAFLL